MIRSKIGGTRDVWYKNKVDSITGEIINATVKAYTWTPKTIERTSTDIYWALLATDSISDPYHGDTPISETLPILCIKPEGLSKSSFLTQFNMVSTQSSPVNWSGALLAFSQPVRGSTLTSSVVADNICK